MMFKTDTYKDTKLTMTEQGYVYFDFFNNWLLHKNIKIYANTDRASR